jgi:uncharacterized membrane protein YukC
MDITERILDKLDRIQDKIADIDKTLVKNTESLEEHIRRTNLLETQLTKQDEKLAPVYTHVDRVNFIVSVFKWVGVSGCVTFIGYMAKLYLGGK